MNVQIILKILQQQKIGEYILCRYSGILGIIWGFDHIEDKHSLYRRKDFMKNSCMSLRELAKNIIDFEY